MVDDDDDTVMSEPRILVPDSLLEDFGPDYTFSADDQLEDLVGELADITVNNGEGEAVFEHGHWWIHSSAGAVYDVVDHVIDGECYLVAEYLCGGEEP